MEPVFYRGYRQEPGDLAEKNMSGHLMDHPTPDHFNFLENITVLIGDEKQKIRDRFKVKTLFLENTIF